RELADVAAEPAQIALGLVDARIETAYLALLLGQRLVDRLELREQRRLTLGGRGRLRPLLVQLALRLLQPPLLGLERIVRGFRGRLGRLRGRDGGEQRADADHHGHDEALHRPRARKPPKAPSAAPAKAMAATWGTARNETASTPSATAISGLSRGVAR